MVNNRMTAQIRMRLSDLDQAIEDCKYGYYSTEEFTRKAEEIVTRIKNIINNEKVQDATFIY